VRGLSRRQLRGFASPERRLLFDVNDFDETLRAPWEWDLKRLAASVVLASRELGLSGRRGSDAAGALVASYREHMHRYARMRALEVWYSHLSAEVFVSKAKTAASRQRREDLEKKARNQTAEHIFPHFASANDGRVQIVDHPPLVYHAPRGDLIRKRVTESFHRYRQSMPDERRIILDRYRIVDVAWASAAWAHTAP